MQNKANFRKRQMCINTVITKNYEQLTMNNELKNKPKTKPIYPGLAYGEAGTNSITQAKKYVRGPKIFDNYHY
jgi:hypothetical protein